MIKNNTLATLQSYQKSVHTMQLTFCFINDEKYMVTASADGCAYCWDLSNMTKIFKFKSSINGLVYRMKSFNTKPNIVAATDSIKVLNFNTQKACLTIQDAHEDSIKLISISKDDKLIATGCVDNVVKIWDVETGMQIDSHILPFQTKLTGLHFLGNKREVLIATEDFITFWDLRKKKIVKKIKINPLDLIKSTQVLKHYNEVIACFYEDGITLISSLSKKKIIELPILGIAYLVDMALTEKLPHTLYAVDRFSVLLEINIMTKSVTKSTNIDDVLPLDVMISKDKKKLIAADDKGGFKSFELNF